MNVVARSRSREARRGPDARGDGGHFLLLSGILLVLAFAATAYTMSQVADLKGETARTSDASSVAEYRFLHEQLRATLQSNAREGMSNSSFRDLVRDTESSLSLIAQARGIEMSVTLADEDSGLDPDEATFGYPGGYVGVVDYDGTALSGGWDGANDGIVWLDGASGRVQAVVVSLYLALGGSVVEETIVVAVET